MASNYPRIIILLTPESLPGVWVETQESIGSPQVKNLISLETAVKVLQDEAVGPTINTLPWVDLLAHESRVAFRQGSDGKLDLVSAMPPHVRTIRASYRENHDPKDVVVHFGPLVWVVSWRSGSLRDARLYACDALPNSLTDPRNLIPFPYGNIREHGDICWGVNSATTTSKLLTLDALNTFFFAATPFTDHIVREGSGGFTTAGFYSWKGGKDTQLPLTRSGYPTTIAQAVKRLDAIV